MNIITFITIDVKRNSLNFYLSDRTNSIAYCAEAWLHHDFRFTEARNERRVIDVNINDRRKVSCRCPRSNARNFHVRFRRRRLVIKINHFKFYFMSLLNTLHAPKLQRKPFDWLNKIAPLNFCAFANIDRVSLQLFFFSIFPSSLTLSLSKPLSG